LGKPVELIREIIPGMGSANRAANRLRRDGNCAFGYFNIRKLSFQILNPLIDTGELHLHVFVQIHKLSFSIAMTIMGNDAEK
jgi:hypothetical protein